MSSAISLPTELNVQSHIHGLLCQHIHPECNTTPQFLLLLRYYVQVHRSWGHQDRVPAGGRSEVSYPKKKRANAGIPQRWKLENDSGIPQDYVPCQGSALYLQDQPFAPYNPSSDQPPRFVCLMPGCSTSCSRANDLDRHYKAQHQSLGLQPEFKCHVEGCHRKENPFNRKDKLREHLRNIHNIGL